MKKYVLSIDQGTTGSTALIVDKESRSIVAKSNKEYRQFYPSPGWVEHDLNLLWESVRDAVLDAIKQARINVNELACIGITNQRETTCAYQKNGEPLAKAIVWQDRRTSGFCANNKEEYEKYISKTGLPLDPYFSGTKMKWLLENNEDVALAESKGNLCLSTIDTFLLYKLSGCKSFYTEPSNASRTLLMDLKSLSWDEELLNFFNVKKQCLPEIKNSFDHFGVTNSIDFLPDGIPVFCMLGDQQAALFGQAGFNKGGMKCTYGTGAFILLNTGDEIIYSKEGLLTTVAFGKEGKGVYALEGSTYIAGAAVQWLRDNLKIIDSASDIEKLAEKVERLDEMSYLTFFPFFTGIGTPYWNADAKAMIWGITRDTENKHIARACLEGIALSVNDSIDVMKSELGANRVSSLKVDGGAVANNLLMQIQSNFSNLEIIRPKIIETTAYGVFLGSIMYMEDMSFEELMNFWSVDQAFKPEMQAYYQEKSKTWSDVIKKAF